GLSEALDHKCSACQMMVRPQRWNDLTDRDPNSEHANTIFTCETCGRMLYYDPRRDAPVRWTPGERLSSASNP
ncbi:MAG: C4-type zinc ribbon domain-containing protein, partial [Acidobacteriota bacterium]